MSSPLPLRTERLLLRAVEDDDHADLLAYYGDPDVARYLPFGVGDADAVRRRIERFQQATRPVADDVDQVVPVVLDLDGRVVGDLMLRFKATGGPRTLAELGWVLHPAYAGRGLATEGARVLVDLAFEHYGCHRVFAQLDARNAASARLCERLGMTREAHLRQDYWSKGEWTDSLHYGLLREEWERR